MKRSLRIAAAVLALMGAGACQLQGLAFKQDQRVEITSPGYRELLDQPVTVEWEVSDPDLADRLGDDVRFGVFVDIDPPPPGESLSYFARNDPTCRQSEGCPDKRYLRQRGIYTTSDTQISFKTLPIAPGVDVQRGDPDFHEVAIVLLDRDGVRTGESAWSIIFEIERGAD